MNNKHSKSIYRLLYSNFKNGYNVSIQLCRLQKHIHSPRLNHVFILINEFYKNECGVYHKELIMTRIEKEELLYEDEKVYLRLAILQYEKYIRKILKSNLTPIDRVLYNIMYNTMMSVDIQATIFIIILVFVLIIKLSDENVKKKLSSFDVHVEPYNEQGDVCMVNMYTCTFFYRIYMHTRLLMLYLLLLLSISFFVYIYHTVY